MPYVTKKERAKLDLHVEKLGDNITNEGQLNYAIYTLMIRKMWDWKLSYNTLNRLIGVFECCKAEFQRRFVEPYEDAAAARNGDIPTNKPVDPAFEVPILGSKDGDGFIVTSIGKVRALQINVDTNTLEFFGQNLEFPTKRITVELEDGRNIELNNPEFFPPFGLFWLITKQKPVDECPDCKHYEPPVYDIRLIS